MTAEIDWDMLSPDDWIVMLALHVARTSRDKAAVVAEFGRDDIAALLRENAAAAEEVARGVLRDEMHGEDDCAHGRDDGADQREDSDFAHGSGDTPSP